MSAAIQAHGFVVLTDFHLLSLPRSKLASRLCPSGLRRTPAHAVFALSETSSASIRWAWFVGRLSIGLSVVGGRVLNYVSSHLSAYITLSDGFIRLWSSLRFVIIGGIVFFPIAMMYGLAQESHRMNRIWPGAVFSLVMWLVLSFLFSYYVENIARYSVIYGTLGAVIVLLLWLYLASVMLIMGAEFNSVLMVLRKQHTAEAEENLGETQK